MSSFPAGAISQQSAYTNNYNLSTGFLNTNAHLIQQLGYNPSDPASALAALKFLNSIGITQPQMEEANSKIAGVYNTQNVMEAGQAVLTSFPGADTNYNTGVSVNNLYQSHGHDVEKADILHPTQLLVPAAPQEITAAPNTSNSHVSICMDLDKVNTSSMQQMEAGPQIQNVQEQITMSVSDNQKKKKKTEEDFEEEIKPERSVVNPFEHAAKSYHPHTHIEPHLGRYLRHGEHLVRSRVLREVISKCTDRSKTMTEQKNKIPEIVTEIYESLTRNNQSRIVNYYKQALGDWALIADIEYRLVNYHARFAGKTKADGKTKPTKKTKKNKQESETSNDDNDKNISNDSPSLQKSVSKPTPSEHKETKENRKSASQLSTMASSFIDAGDQISDISDFESSSRNKKTSLNNNADNSKSKLKSPHSSAANKTEISIDMLMKKVMEAMPGNTDVLSLIASLKNGKDSKVEKRSQSRNGGDQSGGNSTAFNQKEETSSTSKFYGSRNIPSPAATSMKATNSSLAIKNSSSRDIVKSRSVTTKIPATVSKVAVVASDSSLQAERRVAKKSRRE